MQSNTIRSNSEITGKLTMAQEVLQADKPEVPAFEDTLNLLDAQRQRNPFLRSTRKATTAAPVAAHVVQAAQDDRNPVLHLEELASEKMEGRDSPSVGLNMAAKYISDKLKALGALGVNAQDPSGNSFYQTFKLWSWKRVFGMDFLETDPHAQHAKKFGRELFESGYYDPAKMSPENKDHLEDLMNESVKEGEQFGLGVPAIQKAEDGDVQNVVAKIEGTGPNKDEYIVIMCHYDHIGKGWRGTYFGADDNASGSATVLSAVPDLIKAQKEGKLNRSVLFLWTAAEEKGLVGAQYFVDNPLVKLDKVKGVLNLDMVGYFAPDRLSILAKTRREPNYLKGVFEKVNPTLEHPFTDVKEDIDNLQSRQDGAVFSRRGIDTFVFFEGFSKSGEMNPNYHAVGDSIANLKKENNFEKLHRVRDLLVQMAIGASNHQK